MRWPTDWYHLTNPSSLTLEQSSVCLYGGEIKLVVELRHLGKFCCDVLWKWVVFVAKIKQELIQSTVKIAEKNVKKILFFFKNG